MVIKSSWLGSMGPFNHNDQDVYPTDGSPMRGARANQIRVDEAPVYPTDVIRLQDLIQTFITPVPVIDAEDPSPELEDQNASSKSMFIAVYQVDDAFDNTTIYRWEEDVTEGADAPWVVAGDGGYWVAIAGRYAAQNLDMRRNLQANFATILGGAIVNSLSDAAGDFVVNGDTVANLLFVDASLNKVFINGSMDFLGNILANFLTVKGGAIINSLSDILGDFVVNGQTVANLLQVDASENTIKANGPLKQVGGSGATLYRVGGLHMGADMDTVANAGTALTTLTTIDIPAGFFATLGDKYVFECYGSTSNDSDDRVLYIKLDGNTIASFILTSLTDGIWMIRATFIYKSANNVQALIEFDSAEGGVTFVRQIKTYLDSAFTVTNANQILVAGESLTGSDKVSILGASALGYRQ